MGGSDFNAPDLFLIGAPKAGTTSVYKWLSKQSAVCMAVPKEPHFFDVNFRPTGYEPKTFENSEGRLCGEATPTYLTLPFVRKRLAFYASGSKFIVLLREPVSRAYSEWWMLHSRGHEPLSFDAAIEANFEELQTASRFDGDCGAARWAKGYQELVRNKVLTRAYLDHGYYADHLEDLFKRVGRENVLVLLQDDWRRNPCDLALRIWGFLGLPKGELILPDNGGNANLALGGGVASIWRLMRRTGVLRFSHLVPEAWRGAIKTLIRRVNPPPKISVNMEQQLRAHFAPHNNRLRQLLELELDSWS